MHCNIKEIVVDQIEPPTLLAPTVVFTRAVSFHVLILFLRFCLRIELMKYLNVLLIASDMWKQKQPMTYV